MSSSEHVKQWRRRTKAKMVKAMGGGCQCCGYARCEWALEFHHLDRKSKDFSFGSIRSSPRRWLQIVDELRKCVLLCSNCHKEVHAGLIAVPETAARFDESYATEVVFLKDRRDACPRCGNDKPLHLKFCSLACSASRYNRHDWDSIDILGLLKEHGVMKLQDILGVSDRTIYKYRDRALARVGAEVVAAIRKVLTAFRRPRIVLPAWTEGQAPTSLSGRVSVRSLLVPPRSLGGQRNQHSPVLDGLPSAG